MCLLVLHLLQVLNDTHPISEQKPATGASEICVFMDAVRASKPAVCSVGHGLLFSVQFFMFLQPVPS